VSAAAKRVAPQVTRARLLDAAISRLAAVGPDATFDEIAANVGLTKGALYHHFGSKEVLGTEVCKEVVRRHAERVVDASASGAGRQRLQGLIMVQQSEPVIAQRRATEAFAELVDTLL
jgi:AcrR family transcriptional regulator